MASLERTSEGFYGDLHEPAYNAISYTWGRFTATHGSALSLNGITWSVPRIMSNHFTVESFHQVLKKAAGTNGLVWVDIACIDQEDMDVKMEEIGKQADIFSEASQVYVWLSSQGVAEASTSLQALQDFALDVTQNESPLEFNESYFLQRIMPGCFSLRRHLLSLFSDPWFSSLWTLQEACLSDKAHFLSKDAQVLVIEGLDSRKVKEVTLDDATTACQEIKMMLFAYAETNQAIKDLISLMDRSGLSYFHQGFDSDRNKMLLYSAAHHRTCSEPLDRIYGIMQVYGFKLGASSKPGDHLTLAELEDQFGEALNRIAPMTAQTHVHTIPQPFGSAWRPSASSMMPEIYYMSRRYDTMCSVTYIKGNAIYKGKVCSLETLHNFWQQGNALNESLYHVVGHDHWNHYLITIHLDATQKKGTQSSSPALLPQFQNSHEPARSCPCKICATRPEEGQKDDGLARFLTTTLPGAITDYSLLLLGSGSISQLTRASERADGTIPSGNHGTTTFLVTTWSGVLVLKPQISSGEKAWRRVGIVSWEIGRGHLKPVHEKLWEDFECGFC